MFSVTAAMLYTVFQKTTPFLFLLSTQSGDDRETSFLFQRLSVLIQRFNAIILLDSFVKEELRPFQLVFVFCLCIA